MRRAKIPEQEELRLKTLRSLDILDSPPEERFDRLTRLAKRVFGVPIALVSLVDQDRQWFKSSVGLSVSETPREISFCGHAILGNEVFIIPDATKDERFADNPLVINEPFIRFYAGCPLRSLNGSKLGTLCIIDHKPRYLSQEDLETMEDLASMVEREMAAVQLATHDELTKISNRRGFMTLAKHGLSLCARQRISASLVFIDLNEFKNINDKFEHIEGDRALIAFANQMKNAFRDSDIVARFGGDEFVVLLTNSSKELAGELIEKFQLSLDKYNQETDRGYDISFSFGIVEFNSEKHRSVEALLAEGDSLMYKRKKPK